jgi:predicted ferric reductase
LSNHLTWYVARGAGLLTWALLVASMTWGLLYATRVLGRRASAWWLLGVHRFLGASALVFIGIHVAALIADSYVHFSLTDAFVPFTGSWHPVAVGWGIVTMYLLVTIEITSLLRSRMDRQLWRMIHLASYPAFALATVHGLAAGTDLRAMVSTAMAIVLGTVAIAVAVVMVDRRSSIEPTGPITSGPRRR